MYECLFNILITKQKKKKNLQGQDQEKPKTVEGIDNRWVKVMDHAF